MVSKKGKENNEMRTDLEMIEENYVKNGQKSVKSTMRRKTQREK